jgi:hypothetical protein
LTREREEDAENFCSTLKIRQKAEGIKIFIGGAVLKSL